MGYRSDVAISIYKKDFDVLCKEVSEKGEDSNVWQLLHYAEIDVDGDDPEDSVVTMIWSNIKWYDGYDDIDYVMNFIQSEDREYVFKRIGEEADDIEEIYNDPDWNLSSEVYIARYFERNSEGDRINIDDYLEFGSGEAIDECIAFDDLIKENK